MSDDHSSALRLIVPPADEPITLTQAKAFLRIEHIGDDAAVTTAIATARVQAEQYLRTLLLPQTWEYSLGNPCQLTLPLPLQPITSVVSVLLVNEQGTTTALTSNAYRLSVDGRALLFTHPLQSEVVKIQFIAGAYLEVTDIPAPIIQGMLHHIVSLLEHRDGSSGLPSQTVQCYAAFRRISL